MLSPHERSTLFDALRPPVGFTLDAAVGTTFTLDLESLLIAPISFALFEIPSDAADDAGNEPIGLLEAIRRHAGRITVFCQAGQIAVPTSPRSPFAWIEDSVAEVTPPLAGGIFHPKVWVVRYSSSKPEARVLRVLCATRNLTADTSWDTLLRVESEPYAPGQPSDGIGSPSLASLLTSLPGMTRAPLDEKHAEQVSSLAEDLGRIPLVAPAPFRDASFHVLGLDRSATVAFPDDATRSVVISPFLSDRFLREFPDPAPALLVSRPESMDRVDPELLRVIGRCAVLNAAATVDPDSNEHTDHAGDGERAQRSAAFDAPDPALLIGGLHAKLFAFDTPRGCRVFTGSANATDAAFSHNVEVLAELEGPKSAGTAALLDDTKGQTDFVDMLLDYRILDQASEPGEQEELERDLDAFRRQVASSMFRADVTPEGDLYALTLSSNAALPNLDDSDTAVRAWPISLAESQSALRVHPGKRVHADFSVTVEGITSFFALGIEAERDGVSASTRFLVNAELHGAPEDRDSKILAAMLRNPERLLHYLLLLLTDDDDLAGSLIGERPRGSDSQQWAGAGWRDVPLLERLVRAVDRFPERLDHIDSLLDDLESQRSDVLPPGFDALWEPVWEAKRRLGA